MFQNFIEQQGLFVFFVTVYVGAGLIANDRRANALQIYLSKPLLRMEYIGGKLGDPRCCSCSSVTLLPALLLIIMQVMFSGSFEFLQEQPVRDSGRDARRRHARARRRVHDAGAVVALEEQPLRRDALHRRASSSPKPSSASLQVVTGSTRVAWVSISGQPRDQVTDAIFRQPPRYETPVIVSRARAARPGRACRSRCSSGASAAWRWCSERRRRLLDRPRLEVVRPGHRAERRHGDRAAGHHRAARAERRRQEHVHEAHHRPAPAEQGRRQGAGRADLGQSRRSSSASASARSRTRSTTG